MHYSFISPLPDSILSCASTAALEQLKDQAVGQITQPQDTLL